jgi:Glycosyl transferase family 11
VRKIYLSLTGGLGNQLFELAAALAISDGDKIIVEWINSKPRLNRIGKPEVTDFNLPENVIFQEPHSFQYLSSKSVGYILRMGVNPRKYELFGFLRKTILIFASLINVATFRRYVRIGLNLGVGYSPKIKVESRNSLHLIGYFQTFRWIDHFQKTNLHSALDIDSISDELALLTDLASVEEPLVIHMRFGDYRNEKSFGLLTPRYYQESLAELWVSGLYKKVWVFSDEIEEAKKYLEGIGITSIRYISDVASSSAQTLEAMRLGKGYVIGNSSFSWWAAKLSRNQNAKVIAPFPWFIGQEEPADLIPQNWLRRNGHS